MQILVSGVRVECMLPTAAPGLTSVSFYFKVIEFTVVGGLTAMGRHECNLKAQGSSMGSFRVAERACVHSNGCSIKGIKEENILLGTTGSQVMFISFKLQCGGF